MTSYQLTIEVALDTSLLTVDTFKSMIDDKIADVKADNDPSISHRWISVEMKQE